MSIEYKSIVYKGWVVSNEEISQLNPEDCEFLLDTGFLIMQNGWTAKCEYAYVLSGITVEATEDKIICLEDIDWPAEVDAPSSMAKFYELFPNHLNEKPKIQLMLQVI